jgi:two-component system cell cycle sensor histidine kinase/response regulator CckA
MRTTDRKVTLIVTWMTSLMAGIVAVGLPLAYYGLSYSFQDSALRTEAEINARIANELINANPEMWRFEELRLTELLRRRPEARTPEMRRIYDLDNRLVAGSAEPLAPPLHRRRADLRDSGRKVGTIEISRSLRPLLERTGLLAILGVLIGAAGVITLRNIPLRALRRSLADLFEEKERAQVTLRSIGDGVITTDAQGKVQLLNGVAETLTGWTQVEARNRTLSEVFRIVNERTGAVCESPVDRVLREQRTIDLANDTLLIAKDGTEHVIADSGAPIRGENGRIIGVVLVFRDVTSSRKRMEEMQRADKLESVGILAGGIAHDFNNLLTSIMGNISMAQLSPACDAETADLLAKADGACERAKDLTRQLLTFAKGGAPVKETVSLGELIRSSSIFALTGSNVCAEFDIAEDLPPVDADRGQISQVLNNLVINAAEAMPAGGVMTIRADRMQLGGNDLPNLPGGAYVRISVRDRGTGIPNDVLPRIFDPYFTTKQHGSGLGLATCYSIIRKHGGHIAADSEPGQGSTFRFYLPASATPAFPNGQGPRGGVISGRGRVLLMDDEEIIRSTASRMLMRLGYEVMLAVKGEEAIDLFREARESAQPFDAVILDLTIPGGMGGRETLGRLLAMSPDVKAIVSSGYSEDPVMGDFMTYGFCGVLSKPYDMKQMSRVLHQVLSKESESPGGGA